jgi:predicted O-methyltransferase YrrM
MSENTPAQYGRKGLKPLIKRNNMKVLTGRSLDFKSKTANRYWWFNNIKQNYIPLLFSTLSDMEWNLIEEWFRETDSKSTAAEASIPALSLLQGFVLGSNLSNIVQLGHFEGFSTLLLGFMMRQMKLKKSIFTVDIDPVASEKTQYWINRANLQEYVKIVVANSSSPYLPQEARNYFNNNEISFVFIDSSHQYTHTLEELNLWYDNIMDHGLIALLSISEFAAQYDATQSGGASRAIKEWSQTRNIPVFMLNGKVGAAGHKAGFQDLAFKDGGGLGLIQKN